MPGADGRNGRAHDLLVCSHRGPLTYERTEGKLVARRGGGGLIGSVEPALEEMGGTWIAAALTDGDREVARRPAAGEDAPFDLRLLDLPTDEHHLHYDVVSNEYLWFLFHYLFDVPNAPVFDPAFSRAWDAYRRVNDAYAEAVVSTRARAVLIEDYHLMLTGSLVRKKSRSRRPLLYFHHTPWCEPAYFSLLPDAVRSELIESMLAYDVVGFHATRWATAFAQCCDRFVPGAHVSSDGIRWKGRTTRLYIAPVPLDTARLRRTLDDPATVSWSERHDEMRAGRKLLLRVDRIDLSKNPLRGFLAFEQLLERKPQLAEDAVFLALLYPSRLSVERYQRYYADCLGAVRRINERYDKTDPPIHLHFEDDLHRSLGAMRVFDALLVNPVFDGLNLVCKEGAFANERDGSLILSRNAGAFEQLEDGVIPLNPFDVTETADAIERALELDASSRSRASRKLKRLASGSSPAEWLASRLDAASA